MDPVEDKSESIEDIVKSAISRLPSLDLDKEQNSEPKSNVNANATNPGRHEHMQSSGNTTTDETDIEELVNNALSKMIPVLVKGITVTVTENIKALLNEAKEDEDRNGEKTNQRSVYCLLNYDLKEFVEGSGEYGVIVFSLGSIIKSLPDVPETRIITSVLSKLPQRVVWKHDGPPLPNVGRNIKLLKWLPQNDLLGHPKVRLFISHGGLNSVYEALYHAVPMVIIPLMLDDQKENAARVAAKGMGIHLDRSKLTETVFAEAVTKVLNDTSYKATVTRYSEILRDKPPLETAVYWIEHVLKFGGSHLRANVYELNFVQHNLIDVAAFLFGIVAAVVVLATYLCRMCYRIIVHKSIKHSKLE